MEVATPRKHRGGDDAGHDSRLSLDKEIAVHHHVRVPGANQVDAFGIDAAVEHGHGAAFASGASRDVASREVRQRCGTKVGLGATM